jgi:hypothetical protein
MTRASYLSKACCVLIAFAVAQNGGSVMAHPRASSGYDLALPAEAAGGVDGAPLAGAAGGLVGAPLAGAAGGFLGAPLVDLPGGRNVAPPAGLPAGDSTRALADGAAAAAAPQPGLAAPKEAPEDGPCSTVKRRQQVRGKIDGAVLRAASEQLDLPLGAGRSVSINGRSYLFCLEMHYREPGSGRGPQGWHKGVTVFEAP